MTILQQTQSGILNFVLSILSKCIVYSKMKPTTDFINHKPKISDVNIGIIGVHVTSINFETLTYLSTL